MVKITQLPNDIALQLTDFIAGYQTAGGNTTKKILISDLKAVLGLPLVNTTKNVYMNKTADGSGGSTIAQQEADEIQFTGTPSLYGRLDCLIPQDYVAGTSATINLIMYSANTNNQAMIYFVGSHTTGSAFSAWNIQSNQTTGTTFNLTANTLKTFPLYTIAGANLTAGGWVTVAIRPNAAITGNIWLVQAYLTYTANY